MRPMQSKPLKLGGDQLVMGRGKLSHLATLKGKRAFIVIGGGSMERTGVVAQAQAYLRQAGMESMVFKGVEPAPLFSTVQRGAAEMRRYAPDWIIAIGGGSAMDAAKAMWVLYEHPEITTLDQLKPPNTIPKLRQKARFVCIPSTAGSASEVSRSIVITDDATHNKCGIGDMEMMPDVAICDPDVTESMPPHLTAETGMDALTHAIECWVSRRPNYISDVLAKQAAIDIVQWLPKAYGRRDGHGGPGAHAQRLHRGGLGLYQRLFGHCALHGPCAGQPLWHAPWPGRRHYPALCDPLQQQKSPGKGPLYPAGPGHGGGELDQIVLDLQKQIGIPDCLSAVIEDRERFFAAVPQMAKEAILDGCTRTNPLVPSARQFEELYKQAFLGAAYEPPAKRLNLVCYSSLGYPTMEKSLEMIDRYVEAGAEMLELDIPSPDPYYESDVISRHMAAAYAACQDYDAYFDAILQIRSKYPRVGLQLALYENTMECIGIDKVVDFCKKAYIDGLIYVGNEHPEFQDKLLEGGIRIAVFVRYHMPEEEIQIARQSNGFIYLQAKPTYNNNVKPGYEKLADCVAYLRERGVLQDIYCGVGVYTPEDIRMIRDAKADGAYVGSVLLEMEDDVAGVQDLIRTMKAETL